MSTATSPNALCFGGPFPASGVPCHVTVASRGLTIECLGGENGRTFALDFDRVSAEAGGFDHDQLVLHWEEEGLRYTVYLKEPALIAAVRVHARGGVADSLERTAEAVRRHRVRRRTLLLAAVAMVLGGAVLVWARSDVLTDMAVARVPVSWEESLGEAAYRQFLVGHTVLQEGPAVEAMQEIQARLSAALTNSPYTFRVSVVDSKEVNAFALPGGYVVVFTGLLNKAERAEEVAGVLGHEFNHVLKRHAVGRVVRTIGLVAVVTILTGNQQGWAGLIQELGLELATLKFGREQETEADVEGLRLLSRAHIAPEGMVTFFERLAQQDGKQIEILSSHPVSEGRAARLKEEIARLPHQTTEPLPIDWAGVRAALK